MDIILFVHLSIMLNRFTDDRSKLNGENSFRIFVILVSISIIYGTHTYTYKTEEMEQMIKIPII